MSDLISRQDVLDAVNDCGICIQRILDIPSAEPEPKWISVSEALPDTNNDVLLQFPSNMGVGYFEDGYWCIVTGEGLYCGLDDDEEKPVAWMPLPKPYRGE